MICLLPKVYVKQSSVLSVIRYVMFSMRMMTDSEQIRIFQSDKRIKFYFQIDFMWDCLLMFYSVS